MRVRKSIMFQFACHYWDNRCAYCMNEFPIEELTVDHFIPKQLALGKAGNKHFFNLVPSCKPCNQKKGGNNPYSVFPRNQIEHIDRYLRMLGIWVEGDFKCKDEKMAYYLKHLKVILEYRNAPLSAFYSKLRAKLKQETCNGSTRDL